MKKFRLLLILLGSVVFASCTKETDLIETLGETLGDTTAVIGEVQMVDSYNSFEKTIADYQQTLETMENNPDYYLLAEDGFTEEQFDNYVKFFKESINLYSSFIHYEPENVKGIYYGKTDDSNTITDGILVYEFAEIPEALKNIDYDFVNKIYNDPVYLKVNENEQSHYIQDGNILLVVEGNYHEHIDQISAALKDYNQKNSEKN